jgi:hypothetical protein
MVVEIAPPPGWPPRALAADLNAEIDAHLEFEIQENISRGHAAR